MYLDQGNSINLNIENETNENLEIFDGGKKRSLKTRLLKNGMRMYLLAIIGAPAGYVVRVLATGALSPEEIGVFYSILGLITIIASFNDLGLSEALQYFLPKYIINKEFDKAKNIIVNTFFVQILTSIVIGIIVFLSAPFLAEKYFSSHLALDVLKIFALFFVFLNFHQLFYSILLAFQKVRWYQVLDPIRMRSVVLLILIFGHIGILSLNTLAIIFLISLIIILLIGFYGVWSCGQFIWKGKVYSFSSSVFLKEWKYAIFVMLGTNILFLFNSIDQQLVMYFFGGAKSGYRTNYVSIINIIHLISGPIIVYSFPLINEFYTKGKIEVIKKLIILLFLTLLLIGLGFGSFLMFFAHEVTILLYGEQYVASAELLKHGAPFVVLIPLVGLGLQFLSSLGKIKEKVIILFIGVGSMLISSLFMIQNQGIYGVIYGGAIGNSAILLITTLVIYKEIHFKKNTNLY